MRLYIAGPMTNLEDLNYPAFRNSEALLQAAGYVVNNPASIDERHEATQRRSGTRCLTCAGGTHSWSWYMRQAIKMMLDCDGVATLQGWRDSRGARIEVELAQTLEMPVYDRDAWAKNGEEARHQYKVLGGVFL